jgi:hypothetical protein
MTQQKLPLRHSQIDIQMAMILIQFTVKVLEVQR